MLTQRKLVHGSKIINELILERDWLIESGTRCRLTIELDTYITENRTFSEYLEIPNRYDGGC